jgi:NADH:ubiquinone oxidoreductase subunit F (NADH-binding)
LLDIGLNVTRFFRNESCGKCVPCRVGIEKALEHIDRHGSDQSETAQLLAQMHETLERTSLCGLGQVALSPLLSLLERVPATRSRE